MTTSTVFGRGHPMISRFMRPAVSLIVTALAAALVSGQAETFRMRVVTADLNGPIEMSFGPDGYIWVTERLGYRVTRVNPADGAKTVAVTIREVHASVGQDGLLGLALHPQLLGSTGNDYVYVTFTYDDAPGPRLERKVSLRRYTYDAKTKTLIDPVDILAGLPAGNDHVAGRLVFGPDQKLYLSLGDQGNNFAANRCTPNRAQDLPTASDVAAGDWTTYQGKILRINSDGSVPPDNPVIAGVRSHVFSYGHRNVQGLVFGPGGRLYASEHGQGSDDEVNLIEAGRNYGWPHVAGYRDDKAYLYAIWSESKPEPCASLLSIPGNDINAIPKSVPVHKESEWSHPDFREPLQTFFTVENGYSWQQSGSATIAPSGLDIYTATEGGIAGWANSLLVLSLTRGRVYRLKLTGDGRSVVGPPEEPFKTTNRYRDIAQGPDHRTFYLATDVQGRTTDANGSSTQSLQNPGAILEFKYVGP
jgi:PQQ-dependent dehydrogenase (s-GDH family)